MRSERTPELGLKANAAQFTLLVAINALVGGMVGQQQTGPFPFWWTRGDERRVPPR